MRTNGIWISRRCEQGTNHLLHVADALAVEKVSHLRVDGACDKGTFWAFLLQLTNGGTEFCHARRHRHAHALELAHELTQFGLHRLPELSQAIYHMEAIMDAFDLKVEPISGSALTDFVNSGNMRAVSMR